MKFWNMKRYKFAMLGISILILIGIVLYANPAVIAGQLAKSDYRFVLVGFVVALISTSFRVLKWKALLKNVSFSEMFPVQLLGLTISNFTPGKLAEPAKAIILKITKGIDVSSSLTSIIWERLMDVLMLIVLAAMTISGLSVSHDFLIAGILSIGIFIIIITVCVAVLFNKNFGKRLFGFVRKLPILKKLPENFMELFYKVRIKKSSLAKCFLFTAMAWLIEGFTFYFALLAFGVELNPFILSGVVALSIIVGIASSLPGGLGTTEVVMILLLGVLGVESTVAIAGVFVFRLMTFWFGNLMGGLSFIYLGRKFDIKKIM